MSICFGLYVPPRATPLGQCACLLTLLLLLAQQTKGTSQEVLVHLELVAANSQNPCSGNLKRSLSPTFLLQRLPWYFCSQNCRQRRSSLSASGIYASAHSGVKRQLGNICLFLHAFHKVNLDCKQSVWADQHYGFSTVTLYTDWALHHGLTQVQ